MGLFDTFICDPPISCPNCGNNIESLQSKSFNNSLEVYRPGEIIMGSNIHYGIVEEELYCNLCNNEKGYSRTKIFLIIWHSVYVGVQKDENEAYTVLKSIDRLNLLEWLEKYQIERKEYLQKYIAFYNTVLSYHEYESSTDKESFLSSKRNLYISDLKNYIGTEDPLDSILKEYKIEDFSTDIFS